MCLAVALSLPLSGREAKTAARPVPTFRDWSTRHLVYPEYGTLGVLRPCKATPAPSLRGGNLIGGMGGARSWHGDRRRIYFGLQGTNTAVKLTQSGLQ